MLEWAVKLLMLGIVVGVIWTLLRPRYVFEIRIEGGRAQVRRGKVTDAFRRMVEEVCRDGGVNCGWLGGLRRGKRVALRFSRDFTPGLQQRMRNQWNVMN
jgi:hypothetical protein